MRKILNQFFLFTASHVFNVCIRPDTSANVLGQLAVHFRGGFNFILTRKFHWSIEEIVNIADFYLKCIHIVQGDHKNE